MSQLGKVSVAALRLVWWLVQPVVGIAIVLGSLSKPVGSSVGEPLPPQETVVSRDEDGKVRITVGIPEADFLSTLILQDTNGRELMSLLLSKNGDYGFNLGDGLSARVAGHVRRATGRVALAVTEGNARSVCIVGNEGSPHLQVRTVDDPSGPWRWLTPEDHRP